MFSRRGRGRAVTAASFSGYDRGQRAVINAPKAAKSSYLEMRFLISKLNADLIIGLNGGNIKRLHMEYCVMINISDNTTAERIITLGGFDMPTMVNALQDILFSLQTGNEEYDGIGMLLDETEVEYITTIDEYQLNQILEDSGTHIDVFLMCCPQSSDRVIRIKGEPECVARCISSLNEYLEWCPPASTRRPYDAENASEQYATDYGGYVVKSDDLTEQAMDICYDNGDDVTVPSSTTMPPEKSDHSASQVVTVKTSIQSSLVGAILGKGGSRLNLIRNESMANIKLDTEIQAPERIITLKGSYEEVENAKELLRMCIKQFCVRIV